LHHVVPSGTITKAAMLQAFAKAYGREDVGIREVNAKTVIDRTLDTSDIGVNRGIWRAAGYVEPPTVKQMIAELAAYPYPAEAHAE
jgi:hypothetical protein